MIFFKANYNIFDEGMLISADNYPDDDSEWIGIEEKKFGLPTNLRVGASYRLSEAIEVGTDLIVPMSAKVPGAYDSPLLGLGANFEPTRWLQLSAGLITGGNLGTSIPIGIVFKPVNKEASWQIGIASKDISTLLINDNPTMSASFGFLRFGF